MDSVQVDRSLSCQVSPFRDLRVSGYLLLTAAYRSLSRLSSALSAKASTLRPSLLYLKSKSNDRFKSDSHHLLNTIGVLEPVKQGSVIHLRRFATAMSDSTPANLLRKFALGY